MFKTYSDEQQRAAEEARRKEEEELLEAQRRAQEEEEAAAAAAAIAKAKAEALAAAEDSSQDGQDGDATGEGKVEPEGSLAEEETTPNGNGNQEEGNVDASAQSKSPSRPSSAATKPQPPQQTKEETQLQSSARAAMLETVLNGEADADMTIWAPTNVLAELEETDPSFQAYMKMLRRQNPQGKKLFRGKGTKKAKAKPANPLGEKAVTMTDSRGTATADSAKGFKNVFQEWRADEDSSDDDDYFDDAHTHSVASHDDSTLGPGANDDDHDDGGLGSPDKTANTATVDASAQVSTLKPETPTKRTSRPSSRSRTRRGAGGGGIGTTGSPDNAPTLQKKLTVTFDCLQTPALTRLSFMRKYATVGRATQFQKAVDVLSEAAVVAMARQHIVHRASMALKDGLAVLPLIADRLLSTFFETVPDIFASRDPALSAQASSREPIMEPASSRAYSSIVSIVHHLFPNDRVHDQSDNMMTGDSAKELLVELEYSIDVMLDDVQAMAIEELNEPIEMAGASIAAWRKKLKDIIDPPPPQKPKEEAEEKKEKEEAK